MARVLKLRWASTDCDLLAAAAAGLRTQQWYPKSATPIYGQIPPYLMENLDILADRDSDDNLAATLQALDSMRRLADMYQRDRSLREPVWLHAQMVGETGGRRSYVRRISTEWHSNQCDVAGEPAAHDAKLRVGIERHPYWEQATTEGQGVASPLTGASVQFDYTSTAGDAVGDVGGRVALLEIGPDSGQRVDRVWCGFRSTKHGTPANFQNIWECEVVGASAGTDCGAPTTDATASPGGGGNTKRVISFATTTTWAKRLTIELQDVTANTTDQIGRLLWLLRCHVDSATTCEIKLRFGWSGMADDEFLENDPSEISNTSWDYLELGDAPLPPLNLHADSYISGMIGYVPHMAIQIWARRTAGTGSLHLDCLCPIPLDEGWLIAKDISTAADDALNYSQSPMDEQVFFTIDGSYIVKWPTSSADAFWVPPGDGRLVIVYADVSSSVLTNGIIPQLRYYPRWLNLRGSE